MSFGEDETQSAWQLAVLSHDIYRVKHIAVRYVFAKAGDVTRINFTVVM